MDTDDLLTQGVRASTGMLLTKFSGNIPVDAPEGFSVRHTIKNIQVIQNKLSALDAHIHSTSYTPLQ